MTKPERQLRLLQIPYVGFALLCFWFAGSLPSNHSGRATTVVQVLMVLVAIWSAESGFWVQRYLARWGNRPTRSVRSSTPLRRWRAGHLFRLASALSVSLWGLVLHQIGGSAWLADILIGAGLVLLLIWRPGVSPAEAEL